MTNIFFALYSCYRSYIVMLPLYHFGVQLHSKLADNILFHISDHNITQNKAIIVLQSKI